MKKINKKGFTLVELLAVIVILGVLLLIAVPSVTNIINNSKKKAFVSAAKLMIENVESAASIERTTEGALTACYINIDDIKVERGSKGTGYIIVGTDGKGMIYYNENSYYVSGLDSSALSTSEIKAEYLKTLKVLANSKLQISARGEVTVTYGKCPWYTNS